MPPKPKYSAEALIKVSREIIEEKGLEGLSAREISGRLGSTTAPIFTYFGSMDELVKAVYNSICEDCKEYLLNSLDSSTSLVKFCLRWIRYARDNPRFYELIFLLRGQTEELSIITRKKFKEMLTPIIAIVAHDYDIELHEAESVVDKMIIFMMGICVNVVNNVHQYKDEEIENIISECSTTIINGIYYSKNNTSI